MLHLEPFRTVADESGAAPVLCTEERNQAFCECNSLFATHLVFSVPKATRLQAGVRGWLVRQRLRLSNFQELCFHCWSHFQSCKIPFQQQRKTMLELAGKYHHPYLNVTHCKMPFESQNDQRNYRQRSPD